MRTIKTDGIILHRSNYAEADKIITVFTKELGVIKALAKGIRKIKSRRAPHLELFNRVELVLHEGKTLFSITEAKIISDSSVIKSDLKLTGYLFYLSEVISRILPEHQPHPEIYSGLTDCIANISDRKIKSFLVELLWDLGYLPKGEYPKFGITDFIESIIERKIGSKKFIDQI